MTKIRTVIEKFVNDWRATGTQVAKGGQALGSAAAGVGRVVGRPLRLLALVGWLVVRMFVRKGGAGRGRGAAS